MKTLLLTLPIALLATVFSLTTAGQVPPPPATSRIAYVSAQRILSESTEAKADVARLQAAQLEKANELRTKQQALEATRQRLAQSDSSTRSQLQQDEAQQRTDLERSTAQAQADLQARQRQFQSDLQARLRPILADLATAQNIQVVLNADTAVLWSAPGMDLSSAVIERLNAAAAPPTTTRKP